MPKISTKLNHPLQPPIKFVFFGTDEFAVGVLEELVAGGRRPALIITTPDKPKGKQLRLTPPPVKIWADEQKLPCRQPADLTQEAKRLKAISYKLFIVASYGKILPKEILTLPPHGTLNIHPSLLPQYRGPSPIQSALLNGDDKTGVSVMLVDEKMDHGAILKAKSYKLKTKNYPEVRNELAALGAKLLLEILPDWLAGKIKPKVQNETQAVYTKKITKEDGRVTLSDGPIMLDRKFRALNPWPGIYFIDGRNRRVKITAARLTNGQFQIEKVIPAGKREMPYTDFRRGQS